MEGSVTVYEVGPACTKYVTLHPLNHPYTIILICPCYCTSKGEGDVVRVRNLVPSSDPGSLNFTHVLTYKYGKARYHPELRRYPGKCNRSTLSTNAGPVPSSLIHIQFSALKCAAKLVLSQKLTGLIVRRYDAGAPLFCSPVPCSVMAKMRTHARHELRRIYLGSSSNPVTKQWDQGPASQTYCGSALRPDY